MKKAIVYFVLIIFCINSFGTGISKMIHALDHQFQNVETHMHHLHASHSHDDHHQHDHGHHTHGDHEHNDMISFMLSAFDMEHDSHRQSDALPFSLLSSILHGIMVEMNAVEKTYICQHTSHTYTAQCYINIFPTIMSPPPREIA